MGSCRLSHTHFFLSIAHAMGSQDLTCDLSPDFISDRFPNISYAILSPDLIWDRFPSYEFCSKDLIHPAIHSASNAP